MNSREGPPKFYRATREVAASLAWPLICVALACATFGADHPDVYCRPTPLWRQSIPNVGTVEVLAYQDVVFTAGAYVHIFSFPANGAPIRTYISGSPYDVRDLAIEGSTLYVASRYGLWLYDISNPTNPIELAQLTSVADARRVAASGSLVAVANAAGRVSVFEVSNPTQPVPLSSFSLPRPAHALYMHQSRLYCATGVDGLLEYDLLDPSPESPSGTYAVGKDVRDVVVHGGMLYLALWEPEGLLVLDTNQSESGTARAVDGESGYISNLRLRGNTLLAYNGYRLHLFDVLNSAQPSYQGIVSGAIYNSSADIGNERLYIGTNGNLHLYDLNGGRSSVPVSEILDFNTEITTDSLYGYAIGYLGGWSIVDLSNPEQPQTTWTAPSDPSNYQLGISAWNGAVYVLNDNDGIEIYDASNPNLPVKVRSYAKPQKPYSIQVQEGVAYTTAYTTGPTVSVLDLSSPLWPDYRSTLTLPEAGNAILEFGESYLLARGGKWKNGWLYLIDTSEPDALVPVARFEFADPIRAMAQAASHLYVALGNKRIRVLDISDPTMPVELDQIDLPAAAYNLAADGNVLYAAVDRFGVFTYDITLPGSPQLESVLPALDTAFHVQPFGDYLLVSDYESGLVIHRRPCRFTEYPVSTPVGANRPGLIVSSATPNPFNLAVSIEITVAEPAVIHAFVVDAAGRMVADLAQQRIPAGTWRFPWTGETQDGSVAASGVYYAVVRSAGEQIMRKLVLLK